ncbi:hypothetical protein TNCV_1500451 [Trichonephila clavipes]|nr:hypothetical protein TNCV_1500451 [Trichonephila clavipes]
MTKTTPELAPSSLRQREEIEPQQMVVVTEWSWPRTCGHSSVRTTEDPLYRGLDARFPSRDFKCSRWRGEEIGRVKYQLRCRSCHLT